MDNIIIIAAGGGNDIFSSMAYAETLNTNNIIFVAILGLTPLYTVDNITEDPITISSPNLKRYILCDPPKQVMCMESLLTNCICVSSKYSVIEQAHNLTIILEEHGYNKLNSLIHLVDFGGDILTDGSQCISPELDAFSLALVRSMNYNSKVYILFPGVDGELSKEYLSDKCKKAIPNNITVESLTKVYDIVKQYRPGNTIPNMIKVLTRNNDITLNKHWIYNGKKISWKKQINLPWDLQDTIWEFDINSINNPFVDIFMRIDYNIKILLDEVIRIYSQNKGDIQLSDLYLQYLRCEGKYYNIKYPKDSTNCILIDYFPENIMKQCI